MIKSNQFYIKHQQSTLSKFDIIGSYFVNLYYNEFYNKAKNLKLNETYNNLTEAYKNVLSSYLEFSKKTDFFKQIVKGIHTCCISTTKYTTITHKECIDLMIKEFVPSNLWDALRENQKNQLFHNSIISCITIFTEKIILNHLTMIIDHHDQTENIAILQDLFLDIILTEKDIVFSKFINPKTDSNKLEIFKQKIQKIINEKNELIKQNDILTKKIEILESLNKKNSDVITTLQNHNSILIKQIEDLQTNKNNNEIVSLKTNCKSKLLNNNEIKNKKENDKDLDTKKEQENNSNNYLNILDSNTYISKKKINENDNIKNILGLDNDEENSDNDKSIVDEDNAILELQFDASANNNLY